MFQFASKFNDISSKTVFFVYVKPGRIMATAGERLSKTKVGLLPAEVSDKIKSTFFFSKEGNREPLRS